MGQAVPEKPKEPYKIPKVSEKRKKENAELKRLTKEMIKPGTRCTIQSPVCTVFAESLDHIQKRGPKNLTDRKNLTPACNACQLYKEEHPDWAEANGKTKSRFKK